jgi:hypothetical protein
MFPVVSDTCFLVDSLQSLWEHCSLTSYMFVASVIASQIQNCVKGNQTCVVYVVSLNTSVKLLKNPQFTFSLFEYLTYVIPSYSGIGLY